MRRVQQGKSDEGGKQDQKEQGHSKQTREKWKFSWESEKSERK